MGFSGGGSNILKPHTHDSGILQDGGALDMQGVTQGNMSTGSMPYSDGANLQELVKGVDGQTMQLSGGFPSWQTATVGANQALSNLSAVAVNTTMNMNSNIVTNVGAGAGMAKMETIANYETSAATENHTFTFSPAIDLDAYQYLYITIAGTTNHSGSIDVLWNGLTSAYDYNFSVDDNGTWSYTEAASQSSALICPDTLNSGARGILARIWLIPTSSVATEYYHIAGIVDILAEGRSIFHGIRAPSALNTLSELTLSVVNPAYTPMGFLDNTRMRVSGCLC